MKLIKAVSALSALAQESRLQIFRTLMERWPEGMAAGSIGELLKIPATTLSFHLSQLSGAKLIESRKEGRSIIYSANMKRAKKLAKFISRRPLGDDFTSDEATDEFSKNSPEAAIDS